MGYSDSDDSYRSYSKKKKKGRSRSSRSPSRTSNDSRSRHKKYKKSKHKRRMSRSSSSERSHRSSRRQSRGRDRSRSRSGSPYSRRRRSRSDSRSRYSSRSYRRSRSRGRRSRSRSGSVSRHSSRSYRRSRSRGRASRSQSPVSTSNSKKAEPSKLEASAAQLPGYTYMTPAQQAEVKLQLALKAAVDQKELAPQTDLSVGQQLRRAQELSEIESDNFTPAAFTSTRGAQSSVDSTNVSHVDAMFGSLATPPTAPGPALTLDTNKLNDPALLFGPLFDISPEEKMRQWIVKVRLMRQQVLEGEAM